VCGIGGISTSHVFTLEECEMAVRLLASLTRRGEDAWGYYDGVGVYKEPGSFLESRKFETLAEDLLEAETNVFLCHTRLATVGDPAIVKNNHPWNELKPFIFAHNGVLFYTDEFENVWEVETDSFWMYYWIWRQYLRLAETADAIDRGVDHVSGTYACWLHNSDERVTYLFRVKNPIVETSYYFGDGLVVFGSDVLSLADALQFPRRMLRGMLPFRRMKALTIYAVAGGRLWTVGRFTPRFLSPIDRFRFWRIQGKYMKYHIPITRFSEKTGVFE